MSFIQEIFEVELLDFIKSPGNNPDIVLNNTLTEVAELFVELLENAFEQTFTCQVVCGHQGCGMEECAHEGHALHAETKFSI